MAVKTLVVITPHGERRFPGARCEEDEDHVLTVYKGAERAGRFAFGTGYVGYYTTGETDTADHTVTEGAA